MGMALDFLVEIAELTAANDELNKAADVYHEAVEDAKRAADELASKWEGDSQVAFVEHQKNAYEWYTQILDVVHDIVELIRKAIDAYETMIGQVQNTVQG